jgi:hypothetical protein
MALTLMTAQEAGPAPEPVEEAVAVETAVQDAASPPKVEDDVICRRKITSGNKFGQRSTSTKVCKTREEWEEDRRKR